jgi:hypothetical protein
VWAVVGTDGEEGVRDLGRGRVLDPSEKRLAGGFPSALDRLPEDVGGPVRADLGGESVVDLPVQECAVGECVVELAYQNVPIHRSSPQNLPRH